MSYDWTPGSAASPNVDQASVSYDAASGYYTFDLPGTGPLQLAEDDLGGEKLIDSNRNVRGWFTPWMNLTYTGIGYYTTSSEDGDRFGEIVFGTSTPAASVPVTGTASYGIGFVGSASYGDGEMDFDFAKGTLSGHFDAYASGPYDSIDLGHYDFSNTVSAVGSGRFSGQLVNADLGAGSFEGSFTGPHAEELMGRYQMPVLDPNTGATVQDFGVFAGKSR